MRSAPSEQCDNVSDRGVTDTATNNPTNTTKYALIAQSVEHAAVNRGVTGSSPVWGAIIKIPFTNVGGIFYLFTINFSLFTLH